MHYISFKNDYDSNLDFEQTQMVLNKLSEKLYEDLD